MHGKRTTRGALLALGTALVGGGSSPVAQGLVIRDDVADQVYIDAALETEFDSVGRIFTNAGQCTATLIAPDIILTAAHCFGATTLTPTANTFQLQVADPENPGQSVTASVSLAGSTVDIHPGWTGDFNTGVDLALVYLASPITEVAPNQISFATPEEVETQTGTAVGMGRTGDGVTGAVAGTEGTKRAGENRIDSYQTLAGSSVEYFLADFDEPRVIFNQALPTEFAVANGDSGGPLLVADAVTGENRITAVGSFISGSDGAADSDYGDTSGWTALYAGFDWLFPRLADQSQGVFFGDATFDGVVDLLDFDVLSQSFGLTGATWSDGDFNGDGVVDLIDFDVLAQNFGASYAAGAPAATPEPGSAIALAALLPAVLRRRRSERGSA